MSQPDIFNRIMTSLHDGMLDNAHWPATSALRPMMANSQPLRSVDSVAHPGADQKEEEVDEWCQSARFRGTRT